MNHEEELTYWRGAPARFFRAWQRGVALAGHEYFGDGTEETLDRASEKWDLEPRWQVINESFGVSSAGQRLFLAAMYSFYNALDGGELLKQCGVTGLADLSGLDAEHRQIIADLLCNYTGW